ncbi:Translation machinery-associated protein 16 [Phaffia rhodozyma]|uniref:Translation machinery-associated protein 16 n=1 Tax=Phaffia rhodozyma TaxID=264483 RepID=A0A0F7SEL6_PHARH|nr:Translation machinery-associated protein 16 [Phaffia rhodozyma]
MPNNKRHTAKQMQGSRGNDVHPGSRRAGQMDRIVLRKAKLSKASQARAKSTSQRLERPLFFHHSLSEPPFECHTLQGLHDLISEVYLTRWDDELETLRKERRAGRPKSKREDDLEEIKRREAQEYESGFEVPDLTNPTTVTLLRSWTSCDPSFLPQLRYIRVSKINPEHVVVSKKGLSREYTDAEAKAAQEMQVEA